MSKRSAASESEPGVEHGLANVRAAGQVAEWRHPKGADRRTQGSLGRQDGVGLTRFHRGSQAIEGHGETIQDVKFVRHGTG